MWMTANRRQCGCTVFAQLVKKSEKILRMTETLSFDRVGAENSLAYQFSDS